MTLSLIALVIVAPPAGAQPGEAVKWEVEIHGGGVWPTNPGGGTTDLPPPGQMFTTATSVTPAPSSRRESSWYFGDGALLFNQTVTALAMLPGQIAALDPVLARSLGARQPGGSIGVSVSRAFTPRLGAEVSIDYSRTQLAITETNSAAIEATRASYIPAFEGMVRFNRNRVLNSLTSTAGLDDGSSHQLVASAALTLNLRTTGAIVPYATLGAGLLSTNGDAPSTTLSGNYQFLLAAGTPINETDSVTVRTARDKSGVAGILGAGVKYRVSPRWGIRLGIRVFLSKNDASTVLDADPSVTLGLQPAGFGSLGGDPSIQFSNSSAPATSLGVTAVANSSLTGPAIAGFRTFSASGVVSHTNVTAGIFWRF